MGTQYINRNTGTLLKSSAVQHISVNGIVTNAKDCWKFIPSTSLTEEKTGAAIYRHEPLPNREQEPDQRPFLAESDDFNQLYTENREYRFGFTGLQFSTKQVAAVSGLISDPIDVAGIRYLTVAYTVENPAAGAVEISMIDKTRETPILPDQKPSVDRERLFYNTDTRFVVDTTQPVTLYEDGKVIEQAYTVLTPQAFQAHTYTLSYTAAGAPFQYIPESDTVRIKMIVRQYKDTPVLVVHNVLVKKYGGAVTWNLLP